MENLQLQNILANSIKPIEYVLRHQINEMKGFGEYAHKFQCQHDDFSSHIDLVLIKQNSRMRPVLNFFWTDSDLLFLPISISDEQSNYRDSEFWTINISGNETKKISIYSDNFFTKIESTEYCLNGITQIQDSNFENYVETFIKCIDIFANQMLPINDSSAINSYIYLPIIIINQNIQKCIFSSPINLITKNQLETSFENIGYCLYQKKYQSKIINFEKPSKFGDLKELGRRTILIVQADKLFEILKMIPKY